MLIFFVLIIGNFKLKETEKKSRVSGVCKLKELRLFYFLEHTGNTVPGERLIIEASNFQCLCKASWGKFMEQFACLVHDGTKDFPKLSF